MSNIQLAKDALEAELKHARDGLAYYESRIESIEGALATLGAVDTPGAEAPKRRGRKSDADAAPRGRDRLAKTVKPEKAEKPAKKTDTARGRGKAGSSPKIEGEKLPHTGKDFWPNLIGSEPKSASDIYSAAVSALGITPTKEQAKRLSQRMANALSVMSKAGTIKSTGDRGARLYSK